MAYNNESVGDKILRLTNAMGSSATTIASSKANKNLASKEIQLQREKYIYSLDNNVYTASAQKAYTGIENMFYGNEKTGKTGFFKNQLNNMDYETYDADTEAMLSRTLTVDYLTKNFGMTASHAERFIEENGDALKSEAMQRSQTNRFMSEVNQLGTDMDSFVALQAESGKSIEESWSSVEDHYDEIGGSSWDITGDYSPQKLQNKLEFGYDWSTSAAKAIVDSEIIKIGASTESMVEKALAIYDDSMGKMGDESNLSNATISSNRGQFETNIRNYISQQNKIAYDASSEKMVVAKRPIAEAIIEGKFISEDVVRDVLAKNGMDIDGNRYDSDNFYILMNSVSEHNNDLEDKSESNKMQVEQTVLQAQQEALKLQHSNLMSQGDYTGASKVATESLKLSQDATRASMVANGATEKDLATYDKSVADIMTETELSYQILSTANELTIAESLKSGTKSAYADLSKALSEDASAQALIYEDAGDWTSAKSVVVNDLERQKTESLNELREAVEAGTATQEQYNATEKAWATRIDTANKKYDYLAKTSQEKIDSTNRQIAQASASELEEILSNLEIDALQVQAELFLKEGNIGKSVDIQKAIAVKQIDAQINEIKESGVDFTSIEGFSLEDMRKRLIQQAFDNIDQQGALDQLAYDEQERARVAGIEKALDSSAASAFTSQRDAYTQNGEWLNALSLEEDYYNNEVFPAEREALIAEDATDEQLAELERSQAEFLEGRRNYYTGLATKQEVSQDVATREDNINTANAYVQSFYNSFPTLLYTDAESNPYAPTVSYDDSGNISEGSYYTRYTLSGEEHTEEFLAIDINNYLYVNKGEIVEVTTEWGHIVDLICETYGVAEDDYEMRMLIAGSVDNTARGIINSSGDPRALQSKRLAEANENAYNTAIGEAFYDLNGYTDDEVRDYIYDLSVNGYISGDLAEEWLGKIETRNSFVTTTISDVTSTAIEYASNLESLGYDINSQALTYPISHNPDIRKGIESWAKSNPNATDKEKNEYAEALVNNIAFDHYYKNVDEGLSLEFGRATGYGAFVTLEGETVDDLYSQYLAGDLPLLNPEMAVAIKNSIASETFSSEKDFENALAKAFFPSPDGSEVTYDSLQNYQKAMIQTNLAICAKESNAFSQCKQVVREAGLDSENLREVHINGVGNGVISPNGDIVYISSSGKYIVGQVQDKKIANDIFRSSYAEYGFGIASPSRISISDISNIKEASPPKEKAVAFRSPAEEFVEGNAILGPIVSENKISADEPWHKVFGRIIVNGIRAIGSQ